MIRFELQIKKENEKMSYFEIKRRMVELVYILRATPKDKTKRKELANLIRKNRLAWLEVQ